MGSCVVYISCDTSIFDQLGGKYVIDRYTLETCAVRDINQRTGVANFVISFEHETYNKEGQSFISKIGEMWARLNDEQKAVEEAKLFIAWLSTATRRYLDLSHSNMGFQAQFGPIRFFEQSYIVTDDLMNVFHIQPNVGPGKFTRIERPDYNSLIAGTGPLIIPGDFPYLTEKLYSSHSDKSTKFFDACLSYQFSLQNWVRIPSVALVGFVNCVEALMRHRTELSSVEKFRTFFEENLPEPVPKDLKSFLNEVYGDRSNFIHEALIGKEHYRGPIYYFKKYYDFEAKLHKLETITNVGMINWIKNI